MLNNYEDLTMDDVELFIKQHQNTPSARNKLVKHKEAIRRMREAGLSFRLIAQYFKEQGLSITQNSIRVFYQKHIAQTSVSPKISKKQTENSSASDGGSATSNDAEEEYVISPFTGERMKKSELFGTK